MAQTRTDAKTYEIGSWNPVYVVSEKKSFKEYCINASEWIFDFSSKSFSIEQINEKRKIQPCDQKSWIGRGIQLIALLAVTIIFPLGICLAYLKYSHHAELRKPEKVVATTSAGASVKSKSKGQEMKDVTPTLQVSKSMPQERSQVNDASKVIGPDLIKPVVATTSTGTNVKSESEGHEVEGGDPTPQITKTVPQEQSQVKEASKALESDLLKPAPGLAVDLSAANLIQNIDLQKPIHESWLWSNAIRIKEQPWDKNFLTMRELMSKNNTPLLLFAVRLPKKSEEKHGAYGVYVGFMLKIKHEKSALEEDTVVSVVRYSSANNHTGSMLRDECEEIDFESERYEILRSFSTQDHCLQMSREKAIQYSKIRQQSCLPLEEQKSLAWFLYNVIGQKQSVKISELGFFVDESIPNPKANWEVRLATPEEVNESFVRRKAKREAAQAKLERTIIDKLAQAPLIHLGAEPVLEDIHAEMMDKKLSIAQFRDGSIAFMLDVKHIDLKTQPNYHRVPIIDKPIVLLMYKKNEFDWGIFDDDNYYEDIEVLRKFTEEETNERAAKGNQERIALGQEAVAPTLERNCDCKIFRHFLGAHSLKLEDNTMALTFLTSEIQDQLPKEYQKSLAWIVYRLLNGRAVSLIENQVPVRRLTDIPSKPCGYWKLSLAKF